MIPSSARTDEVPRAGVRGAAWFVRTAAVGVLLLAAIALVGWLLNRPLLASGLPGYVAMKANTAIALAVAALALWLLRDPAAPAPRTAVLACAVAVATLGAASLFQYLLGMDLGIDQLLFREPGGTLDTSVPGRMAALTAAAFIVLGVALGATAWPRTVALAQAAAVVTAELGLLTLVGYVLGADSFIRPGGQTPMAVPTALAFVALGSGVFSARPDVGLMRTVTSGTVGGTIVRRMLLPAILLPPLLQWLERRGPLASLLSEATVEALLTLVTISTFGVVLLTLGRALDRGDRERQSASAMLREANERLETRVAERTAELERVSLVHREGAERLRAMVHTAHDAIVIADSAGIIVGWNPGAERIFGYTEADLLGQEVARLVPQRYLEPHLAGMSRIRAGGPGRLVGTAAELTGLHKDGREVPIELSLSAWTSHEGVFATALIRDISERKQAEHRQRRLLELLNETGQMAQVGGWQLNVDTQTLQWTDEVFRIYEVEPRVQPSVAEAILYYAPESRPVIAAALQAAIDAGTPFDLELSLVTARGRRRQVRAQGHPERHEGRVVRVYGAFQDITERLALESQFRQAQRMENVGQLASGIAHDFNNLLSVINGTSELLLEQVAHDETALSDVKEILGAGERAASLTRQLLAFSRQQVLAPRVLDLNIAVAEMEGLLRRLLREDIELTILPAPGGVWVKVDPGQLDQIMTNLAVNACDAMPTGGRLTLTIQDLTLDEGYHRQDGPAESDGPYAMLAVTDSGVGMDAATRAHVFEPFFTTKPAGHGTGLGLSTVYGIVRQSGGFVTVESEVGRGTTFRVYLPRVTGTLAIDRLVSTPRAMEGNETILVVEDTAGLRKLARRFLEGAGYAVIDAENGEEALRLLAEYGAPVHLLLSDVVMPGMSGRVLAEQVVQIRPRIKVLYMSGYTSDTVVRHGVLEEETPFLQKPFTKMALLGKVREVLDKEAR